MIRYLLDTDTASYVLKRRNPVLRQRVLALPRNDWAISAISCAEIFFGLESLPSFHAMRIKVDDFFETTNILPWPVQAAAAYASIRYRTRNQPLHDRDIFIAAHAIALDATLVTNNIRHFTRMGGGLRYENWLEAPPIADNP
jgi:tRNA(fMet)-specific endonuclease VapC